MSLKQQRDRFMAFSFATSDLVFEVDPQRRISFVSGASQRLLGCTLAELEGRNWTEIFALDDVPLLTKVTTELEKNSRCQPLQVSLARDRGDVVFSACRLPIQEGFLYCTLTRPESSSYLSPKAILEMDAETGLLEPEFFATAAQRLVHEGELADRHTLTLLDLSQIDPEAAHNPGGSETVGTIASVLRHHALGGQMASHLGHLRFGVIHDRKVSKAQILSDVHAAKGLSPDQADPEAPSEDQAHQGVAATLSIKSKDLAPAEAGRALLYAINSYAEAKDERFSLESLDENFTHLLAETNKRIFSFKTRIERGEFDLAFQPVIDLETRVVSHHEVLARFAPNESPFEMITFAERVGLIADFDLTLVRRVVQALLTNLRGQRQSLAINISGRSVENDNFITEFLRILDRNRALAPHMLFEITESSEIHNLERVGKVIQEVRRRGFKLCLDDFGAGAASFHYLQALNVDYIKIDGRYIRNMMASRRDSVMLKAISGLCSDLSVVSIAEMVEEEVQVDPLKMLGVDKAQGYLFGVPKDQPLVMDTPSLTPAYNPLVRVSQTIPRNARALAHKPRGIVLR